MQRFPFHTKRKEPSSCSVILDSCSGLTVVKDVKSTEMTYQDNKQGFLCDQHLSSEFLVLSAVLGYLTKLHPPIKITLYLLLHIFIIYFFL